MSLVLSNKGKGMQSSSEQPLVGEEHFCDDPDNGCEGDYSIGARVIKRMANSVYPRNHQH